LRRRLFGLRVEPTGVDAVFAALADPTRRGVLDALSRRGPLSATQLAEGFPVTRQAVVKHLGALSEAGLVTARRQGREVRYEVATPPLGDAVSWLTQVGARWDHRLAALGEHLRP
jgi:DNA-binding transcriptional ArsR family regulator